MSGKITNVHVEAKGDEEPTVGAPLLSSAQGNFTTTSTGSMQLVGLQERRPVRVSEFEAQYRQPEDKTTVFETVKEAFSKKCAKFSIKKTLTSNFPILRAMKKYRPLQDLPNDLVAGITAGIMMIPQSMAFASLSTLQPINGLYIALFSSLTYFFLGTGQQSSFGCIAILSIMMGSILDKYVGEVTQSSSGTDCSSQLVTTMYPAVDNETASTTISTASLGFSETTFNTSLTTLSSDVASDPLYLKKVQVAGAVSLLCGIIFAILGKVGLGKVTIFMSDSLVTGVTVGAAFHVGSSQLKTMFGLQFLPRQSGIFKLLKLWYSILANIHHSNVASIIASAICILLIYLVKRFINEKYKKKLRVPIPIELIVMILATLVSYFADLNEKFDIGIIKDVPVGVPKPHFPDLSLGTDFLVDGLVIIIVAFAQTVSIAKLMGLKNNYKVDANQEMFAIGMVNIICAVFSGYICGASVSRSVVQDSAGGRTQIASLFAASLVLLVMLFIGPYFYHVPKCSLSAIIIVSLRSLMLKLLTIPDMWRKSKVDCVIFVTTVAATVILDADIGLFVGVAVSIFLVLLQSIKSSVDVTALITVGPYSIWRSKEKYFGGEEMRNIKVIRINGPLYFVNAEITTDAIFKKTGLNPLKMKMDKPVQAETNGVMNLNCDVPETGKQMVDVEAGAKVETSAEAMHNGNGTDMVGVRKSNADGNENLGKEERNAVNSQASVGNTHRSLSDLVFTTLILDLSCVSFIDLMGVKALEFVIEKYKSIGIRVYVTNVTEKCLDTLKKSGFIAKHGELALLTVEAVYKQLEIQHGKETESTKL